MTLLQKFTSILQSEENKDEKSSGRRIPPGFEKILKRTKRGMNFPENKEEKEASTSDKKEEDKKGKEEEAELSEQEEEPKQKKAKQNNSSNSSNNTYRDFLIDPQNGGPNWENFLKLALIGGIVGYYAWISQS